MRGVNFYDLLFVVNSFVSNKCNADIFMRMTFNLKIMKSCLLVLKPPKKEGECTNFDQKPAFT